MLFSAASDTVAENNGLFSAASPGRRKLKVKNGPRPFFSVSFCLPRPPAPPSSSRRAAAPGRPRAAARRPRAAAPRLATRRAAPLHGTPAEAAVARATTVDRRRSYSTAAVQSPEPPPSWNHSAVVAKLFPVVRYFLRFLFHIFGGRYLIATEISMYL